MKERKVKIKIPCQGGTVAYQIAKLKMLKFHYGYLEQYVNSRDFELNKTDHNQFVHDYGLRICWHC